ncbi:MAG: substrate-binding domain-containing protein [Lentisphaeria bacterium]|nr:substrate-binding domain-containing protein [Lentisphaeria bacterium]
MITPIYRKISERLEAYIREHGITGKLPGTRQLSRELGCHHVTIAKAIRLLAEKGLLENRGVRGVFVREHKQPRRSVYHVVALIDSLHETPTGREKLARLNAYLKPYGNSILGIRYEESLFQENPRLLLNFPVDGFMFRFSSLRGPQAKLLRDEGIPAVSCSRLYDVDWLDQTDCDHAAGYGMMLERLFSAGHRRIAWIDFGAVPDYRPYQQAIAGYFQEHLKASFDPGLIYVRETVADYRNLYGERYTLVYFGRALAELFSRPSPPTAIIVPSIAYCNTLCSLLAEMKLRVPEDVTVMCVNHGGSRKNLDLPVPCVEYDEEAMLGWAIRRLMARLREPGLPPEVFLAPPAFHDSDRVAPPSGNIGKLIGGETKT